MLKSWLNFTIFFKNGKNDITNQYKAIYYHPPKRKKKKKGKRKNGSTVLRSQLQISLQVFNAVTPSLQQRLWLMFKCQLEIYYIANKLKKHYLLHPGSERLKWFLFTLITKDKEINVFNYTESNSAEGNHTA